MAIKTQGSLQSANDRGCACKRLLGLFVVLFAFHTHAGPLVTPDSPIGFFTNIASRLLSAQMGLELNHIQVYPTNQYTPAVHRVLQVTANLYDAATNRPFANDYPYLPSVFRPLFRRDTNGAIFIAGYREVTDDRAANFSGAGPANVVLGVNNGAIPPEGTPVGPDEISEPLVSGIPLVIGAKKGLPNFNEFGMQTSVQVTRRLEFRRLGSSNAGPIVETNQMYLVSITNTWGVEAWNSYQASYPRNLELRLNAVMTAVVTNDSGVLVLSNSVFPFLPPALVAANTWPAFSPFPGNSRVSFKAHLDSFLFMPTSMYWQSTGMFMAPGAFERGVGFPVPHWFLSLRPIIRFALVDTSVSPSRIVDYVSLDSPQAPVDVMSLLTSGGQCGSSYTPDVSLGSMWCTNRDSNLLFAPTYGVLNQIGVGAGQLNSFQWSAQSHGLEIDFFRAQFGLAPIYNPSAIYLLTNVFSSPYSPTRVVNWYTSWQANDPLVHYTIPDLSDGFASQPAFELDITSYSPLAELGGVDFVTGQPVGSATPLNTRYRPWGGSPQNSSETMPPTNWRLELKDPLRRWSDDWAFPTNPIPDLNWLGQVHRGTPWQTIYLKSTAVDLPSWIAWTGNRQVAGGGLSGLPPTYDAAFTLPTNDWHLASLLVSLLSTNDPRTLLSVNEPDLAAWTGALDGLTALTNTSSENQLRAYRLLIPPLFDTVLVDSNSPQAALIATAVSTLRASEPGQRFLEAADILAVPELSVASPFLNQGSSTNAFIRPAVYTYQQTYGLSDAAYEALPAQLLPRLRPDSLASLLPGPGPLQVQFTGADGYRYAVEVSSNLVDWVSVSTNYPSNGQFLFQESSPPTAAHRFYRSSLLP